MSTFIKVCEYKKLADGSMRTVSTKHGNIVVVREGDNIYALANECTHEEFPLSEGWIEDGCIHCAFHGAKFDLKTGEALSLPAYENIVTYPVRINDGMIEIKVE
ncbi:non-heme iron oxygenase ferredoxin subunit [candidate division KSB1 bacterium]|nr:non-heme iron oxygenase ferredoxin subunit [candidate division KSB1 bacterium]RQW01277.1 MAG: non-heme iron oxygenase ferredoxin subunit [candidate division KSB1 bacterium]